jgi:excinuclease ABC subunit A
MGNTVIVVEHNLDVVKTADWVIDMGPEAGIGGGTVVATGTPEDVVKVPSSHTGRILVETLAEGPFVEREKYDAKKALAKKLGDINLEDVGKSEQLPWEKDGPKWHVHDRITTKGTPIKWEGSALESVIEQVEALAEFSPTNWNHRSIVEVIATKKSQGYFLHAMTGHEAYLKLVFRVMKNTFKEDTLKEALKLRPLSDYAGHEGYSRDHRVEVENPRGPVQMVVVTLVKKEEAESPQFQAFLKQASESYAKLASDTTGAVEAAMPWKLNGEAWHLGAKGFTPGRTLKWDKSLLPKFLELLKSVEPKIDIKWDLRDAVGIRVPGITRLWIRIKTKELISLEVWLMTKPSQFNPDRFEGIGRDVTIESDRHEGSDLITMRFVTLDHLNAKAFKPLLVEHLKGFRELRGD